MFSKEVIGLVPFSIWISENCKALCLVICESQLHLAFPQLLLRVQCFITHCALLCAGWQPCQVNLTALCFSLNASITSWPQPTGLTDNSRVLESVWAGRACGGVLAIFLVAEAYVTAFTAISPTLVQLPVLLLISPLQNRHCEVQACCSVAVARRGQASRVGFELPEDAELWSCAGPILPTSWVLA